ncbi:hypothetical protein GO755_18970 [Spirosoma sp. HMF4905]|uniref:PAS domain-containing protein n=1 Tax=Spirosoma arboris TaxID=2682092 RepID=A0A7K1SEB3_9BACT|nr:hypothetical protein [Spirosoma arboris]MVM32140.1 hypothetical protein [Spirosoma arboris]
MHSPLQAMPGNAPHELFPHTWLASEPIRTLINTAPLGLALLQSLRNETGQITDFSYQLVNPMLCALTNHPPEDLLSQPLTVLSPDVIKTGMLDRLIQVVNTGKPDQHVEEYQLDGNVSHYDQLYLTSGDGVLMLTQDITFSPLSAVERGQQTALLDAIANRESVDSIRDKLLVLLSGQMR